MIAHRKPGPRSNLSPEDVTEIFSFRCQKGLAGKSLTLAEKYGISQKAVRDIWNGRTWRENTNARRGTFIDCESTYFTFSEYQFLVGNNHFADLQYMNKKDTAHKPRTVITKEQAAEIFNMKHLIPASTISLMYGVRQLLGIFKLSQILL